MVNGLIGHALDEAADREAVTIARRFRFRYRYAIYRAAALSPRALQLAAVFPALALAIYAPSRTNLLLAEDAAKLVDRGAPMKQISELMGIPVALRKVKPGAADLALSVMNAFHDQRLWHAYLPDSLPQMKLWLRCLNLAAKIGPDFLEWVARHSREIGGTPVEVLSFLTDLTDWVQAGYRANAPPDSFEAVFGKGFGEEFVVRTFHPDMSLKTVTMLSNDWHDAIANLMSGNGGKFPEPWCNGGQTGGYDIIPIGTDAELYGEGHAMHHCVGSYACKVRDGEAYFFSIRKNEDRVATLELVADGTSAAIGQIRGPCNGPVSKDVSRAVRKWLRSQPEFRLPKERDFELPKERDFEDDEIPF